MSIGARMPSKHLESPELDSLFLTPNQRVYEPLPRLEVSAKDTQRQRRRRRREGKSDRREGCHRQRDAEMSAETEGDTERGGRWKKTISGALGKDKTMEKKQRGWETQT